MIKPASGSCNMNCKYCFYCDIMQHRSISSYGIMDLQTLENVVKKTLDYAARQCTFAFQGGEPTLAGIEFFRKFAELQKKYNTKNVEVNCAIQTNGLTLDEEWAAFFKENDFLVGVSVDGNKAVHDSLRLDRAGNGTYDRVTETVKLFDKYGVKYNILTVVTKQVALRIAKIYRQYKKNGWFYMQFIPCLEPLGEARGGREHSLTPELYVQFLKTLFDLWYEDIVAGNSVYIRDFENLLGMMLGYPPESCSMSGVCSPQYVVEADGSVYPCDFYVLDEYKIGNLNTDSFEQIDSNRDIKGFIQSSYNVDEGCRKCQWLRLCRTGCRRDRETPAGLGRNYFCAAYKKFYPFIYERLEALAYKIKTGQ